MLLKIDSTQTKIFDQHTYLSVVKVVELFTHLPTGKIGTSRSNVELIFNSID
jgi:hypothetical protein